MREQPPRCAAREGALLLHAEYVRRIADRLPADARRGNPRKLWDVLALLLTYVVVLLWASEGSSALAVIPAALSLSALMFLAHDVSHGTVVRAARRRYPLEVFLWALNFIPATVWRRRHNQAHHFQLRRVPSPGEPRRGRRETPWSTREKTQIAWETAFIVLLHGSLFLVAGNLWSYFVCSPAAALLGLAVAGFYLATNHTTDVDPAVDPVLGTTSVIVPRILDRLHSHYSYHVEHHLFPGVDSSRYPAIGAVLEELFPDRYRRLPVLAVWRARLVGKRPQRSST